MSGRDFLEQGPLAAIDGVRMRPATTPPDTAMTPEIRSGEA